MSVGNGLIMTDWAAYAEGVATDRDLLLWELVLHSLLRDEILIQDEALAQSEKLAGWFQQDGDFRILEELIRTGIFSVVVQPPETYTDSKLQELSVRCPVQAKRESILLKHGKPFQPTESLKWFHTRLDHVLTREKATCLRAPGVQQSFASILANALRDDGYDRWFERQFRVSKHLRHELASFVEHPSTILDRLTAKPILDPKFKAEPMFTRNLGHQLAQTYANDKMEDGINALIHSAYARALTSAHGRAAGRYNEYLQPLLPAGTQEGLTRAKGARTTEVAYRLATNLKLPALTPGLCERIQNARSTDEHRELRNSLKMAGQQLAFEDQQEKWRAFADVLAEHVPSGRQVPLWTLVADGCKIAGRELADSSAFYVFWLALHAMASLHTETAVDFADLLAAKKIAEALFYVATDVGVSLTRIAAENDEINAELRRAVTFVANV